MSEESTDNNVVEAEVVPEQNVQDGENAEPKIDGILVHREYGDNGDINTSVQLFGDVKTAEVVTILEVAVRNVRKALNL